MPKFIKLSTGSKLEKIWFMSGRLRQTLPIVQRFVAPLFSRMGLMRSTSSRWLLSSRSWHSPPSSSLYLMSNRYMMRSGVSMLTRSFQVFHGGQVIICAWFSLQSRTIWYCCWCAASMCCLLTMWKPRSSRSTVQTFPATACSSVSRLRPRNTR